MPAEKTPIEQASEGMANLIYQNLHDAMFAPLNDIISRAKVEIDKETSEVKKYELKINWGFIDKAGNLLTVPKVIADAEDNWRMLSEAIAQGVVKYITENMKVVGIQTSVNIAGTVSGNTLTSQLDTGTTPTPPEHNLIPHHHLIDHLNVAQNQTEFTQTDKGEGHIQWKT